LEAAKDESTLELACTWFPRAASAFWSTGHKIPEDGPEKLADSDAIYPGGTATPHELTYAAPERLDDSARREAAYRLAAREGLGPQPILTRTPIGTADNAAISRCQRVGFSF
jgi:isocitrate/isopropylmalate dehydrogenase